MGLAASQARLLTITARLADNELRSQTINNAKMRLATQSSQASDDYISALNNAQLMFSNTDINGLARNQVLTYNNLTAYSQYNNQYGLVNSAGLLLVSEQDAKIYEASGGNMENFLKAYGLEWGTTFFSEENGNLSDKLTSFYGVSKDTSTGKWDLGVLFQGLSNAELERIYQEAQTDEASIERLNYDIYASAYYQQIKAMYDTTVPAFRQQIIGDSSNKNEDELAAEIAALGAGKSIGVGDQYIRDYIYGNTGKGGAANVNITDYVDKNNDGLHNADDMTYCYNNVKGNLTTVAQTIITDMIESLTDYTGTDPALVGRAGFMDTKFTPGAVTPEIMKYDKANGSYNYTLNSDGTHSYDYNFVGTNSDDVYLKDELTTDINGNKTGQYYSFTVAGIKINIDAPKMVSDGSVTWQTSGTTTWKHNTTGATTTTDYGKTPSPASDYTKVSDDFSTDSHDVKKQVGIGTYVDEDSFGTDGEGGIYDPSVISILNSYLSGKHKSDFEGANLKTTLDEIAKRLKGVRTHNDGEDDPCIYRYNPDSNVVYRIPLEYSTRKETYESLVDNYLNSILNAETFFNPSSIDNPALNAALDDFSRYDSNPWYGSAGSGSLETMMGAHPDFLVNFVSFLEYVGAGVGKIGSYNYGSEAFHSVLTTYINDLMIQVLGEPKYTWIDTTDPSATQNADAKAQWYENLFNRMQRGYKVLENGLANSKEWIEYAFESGLVTMEQVDKSYNWLALDYKACTNIYEDSDTSDLVAKAEAKYNRAMNDIKQKDNMYDLQLKNIDTEHQSLQTEYDSIKGVITKNIDRTMKFDQSA